MRRPDKVENPIQAAPASVPAPSVYFVYALSTVNSITVNAAQVLLSLYALKLGATPLEVGALAGSFALFPMLLGVMAGRLLDRYGGRWPMTLSILSSGVGMLIPYFSPSLPALYVAGDRDLVVRFPGMEQLIANLSTFVPQLRRTIMLPECGHWTQQERAREVSDAMLQFLEAI